MSASERTLQAVFDACNRHDAEGVLEHMTDDVVFDTAAGPQAHGTRITGKRDVGAAFTRAWTTSPDVQWKNTSHFVAGDCGVSQWTFTATMPDGGRVEADGCDIVTFRDGRICRKQAFRKDRPPLDPGK